jgi:hypothetical protein
VGVKVLKDDDAGGRLVRSRSGVEESRDDDDDRDESALTTRGV